MYEALKAKEDEGDWSWCLMLGRLFGLSLTVSKSDTIYFNNNCVLGKKETCQSGC